MKRRMWLVLAAWWSLVGASAAQSVPAPPEFAAVRTYVLQTIEKGLAPSVAVAVVREGQLVWAEGFGQADIETNSKATADSIYRLASISKPIAATGLMLLVERGLVDLEQPANRYLPGPKLRTYAGSDDAMTIRRLANHTAGLPVHYSFFYTGVQPPSMDETIRRYGFADKQPGSEWEYSNLGYGVLGHITEVVSRTPWRQFMIEQIYRPLGMDHTDAGVRPGRERSATAQYTRDAGGRFVRVAPYEFDHPAASVVWSSARDLARFARMHLGGGELDGKRVLTPDAIRKMQMLTGERSPGQGTGIGWSIATIRGRRCIWHSGTMPGVANMLRIHPDDGCATVVLTNGDAPSIRDDVSDRLAAALVPENWSTDRPAGAPVAGPTHFEGAWRGKLVHFDGDLPITLFVQDAKTARVELPSAAGPLRDVSTNADRLTGRFDVKLRTQEGFHGVPIIELRLRRDGSRLNGVAVALASGYFALSHYVQLDLVEPIEKVGNAAAPVDLLLRGGGIVDGCGTPWFLGDVAIHNGRIAAIGRRLDRRAERTLDVSGLVVAPGFIDMMGQTGTPFLEDPHAGMNLLTQGITTINAGEGHSAAPLWGEAAEKAGWRTMAEYFDRLDEVGMPINMVQTVGHTQVRRAVLGETDRQPTPDELRRMQEHVREAMEAGAVGLSTALIYPPAVYASTGEISALARVAGEYGGAYFTHMRNEGDRLLEAIDEALEIGRTAHTAVHIFHLKAAGQPNWPKMRLAIEKIEAARASGQQVGADIYPYVNNGLGITAFLHPRHAAEGPAILGRHLHDPSLHAEMRRDMEEREGWENWYRHIGRDWGNVVLNGMTAKPFADHNGKSLADIAKALGKDTWETFFEIARVGAFALPLSMSEENTALAMRQPFVCFDTDVGPVGGSRAATHPRAYGAFPRVLARYVGELGVLSLEEAINRMTASAANELMLHDRGRLAEGLVADLVVFDPLSIRDRATLADPTLESQGVRFLIVNGKLVLDDGKYTSARPGRVIRGRGHRSR